MDGAAVRRRGLEKRRHARRVDDLGADERRSQELEGDGPVVVRLVAAVRALDDDVEAGERLRHVADRDALDVRRERLGAPARPIDDHDVGGGPREAVGDGPRGAARADDEAVPAVDRAVRGLEAVEEPRAVHVRADDLDGRPLAQPKHAHDVRAADGARLRRDVRAAPQDRLLVRLRDDEAVDVARGDEAGDDLVEGVAGHVERQQDGVADVGAAGAEPLDGERKDDRAARDADGIAEHEQRAAFRIDAAHVGAFARRGRRGRRQPRDLRFEAGDA